MTDRSAATSRTAASKRKLEIRMPDNQSTKLAYDKSARTIVRVDAPATVAPTVEDLGTGWYRIARGETALTVTASEIDALWYAILDARWKAWRETDRASGARV